MLSRNLFGVRVEDRGTLSMSGGSASGNINAGFNAVSTASAAEINLSRVLVSNKTDGVAARGALGKVNLSYVSLFGNTTGLDAALGGSVVTTAPAANHNAGNTAPGAPTSSVPLQ